MVTRSQTARPNFFDESDESEGPEGPEGPEGSEDDSDSDFECDSPPSSPTSSSEYESIISEDLNLYDTTCVCQLPIESHELKCKRV